MKRETTSASDGRDIREYKGNHLEWVFVRRQEPFIVAPAFDEGETARLARRVCQSVDDILCVCVWSTNGSQLENKQKAGQLGRANQKEKRISISLFFFSFYFILPTWHVVRSQTPHTTRWIPSTQTFNSIAVGGG